MPDTKEPIHLAKLLAPHKGKWVALSHDERSVLGVGTTIDEALEGAKKKGESKPVLIKSPDEHSAVLL